MLRKFSIVCLLIILCAAVTTKAMAAASGVFRLELPDAATVGKGSAFVGEANRASAVYYNPAGITQIGTELSVGLTVLRGGVDYTAPSGDKLQSRRNTFVFPHVYFTTPVVQDKFYLGIGESSNWGSGYEWADDVSTNGGTSGFTRYSMVHDKVENKDFMLVGAYKFNEQWSFALGAVNDDAKLEKEQKLFQTASSDGDLQTKIRDNAWGWTVGGLYKMNEQNQFGLTYRSPIAHKYEGKVYLNNLNAGSGYQALFGGTAYETTVASKMILPQSVALGYSYKPTSQWRFNFDLEWLDWSSVEEQAFTFGETNAARLGVLGAANHPRDWKSVWSESFGAEYTLNDRTRLRAGYAHHQSPIGQDTWDTTFPDANSNSFTFGVGYDVSKNVTVDLAYVIDVYDLRKIDNTVDNAIGANLDGNYKQYVNIGMVTLTYKF